VARTVAESGNSWKAWLVWLGTPFGLLVVIWFASPWVIPPPLPDSITIATGSEQGNYYRVGRAYAEYLSDHGVALKVRKTAGSVENLELLNSGDVDLAIVQGGVRNTVDGHALEAMGSLYLEPVWLFHQPHIELRRLTDLSGLRVAVGQDGSGTQPVVQDLMSTIPHARRETIQQHQLAPDEAVTALQNDELDAAFFIQAPDAPLIAELLWTHLKLFSFARATAFSKRFPYLKELTITEGMLDLERNIPQHTISTIAPTAVLMTNHELHRGLIPILLEAATHVHEGGGLFEQQGEFPSRWNTGFPVNDAARRYYVEGLSFFYRYFPFQIAATLDRLKILFLPLITLLYPLSKAIPPLNRWRIRSRIYRWYRVLREIDFKMIAHYEPDEIAKDIQRLQHIEDELAEVSVPLSYMEEFYNLRLHVAFVLEQLHRLKNSANTDSTSS